MLKKKSFKVKKEKSAMSVSLYGNLFFVIVELVMAVYTASQAVLLDAVYDGIEFIMLLPSIFLIPLLYKPFSEKHPFGYMQLETLFLVIKGITMSTATIGLIANNIMMLFHGGHKISYNTVAYFEFFACILGIAVTIYLSIKNKALNSPIIAIEMQGWKIDSLVSLGMGIAFMLPILLPFDFINAISPYLDQIITIILSMIMLPVPIRAVVTGIRDLMLISPDEETLSQIKGIVEPILSGYGYSKYYFEVIKTGRRYWISVYVRPKSEEESLSVELFKTAQSRCIEALEKEFDNFYFELLPDIEYKK